MMNIVELHKYYNKETYDMVKDFLGLHSITFFSDRPRKDDNDYFATQDFFFRELVRYKGCHMTVERQWEVTYLWNSFLDTLREKHYSLVYNGQVITKMGVEIDPMTQSLRLVPFFDALHVEA